MYQACCLSCTPIKCSSHYDRNMIACISGASNQILVYFSQEFEIEDRFHRANPFLFPYLGDVLTQLLKTKSMTRIQYAKEILECCIHHNQKIYTRLKEFRARSMAYFKCHFPEISERELMEAVRSQMQRELTFFENESILSYRYSLSTPYDGIVTNIISVDANHDNVAIQSLIDELVKSHEKILALREM